MTSKPKPVPRLRLTLDEAAEAVGLSPDTLRAAVKKGRLRAKRTGPNGGGKHLFSAADIEAWIEGLEDA